MFFSFCEDARDSAHHLFFECAFCSEVLKAFQSKGYCLWYAGDWEIFIRHAAENWRGKLLHCLINKIVLAAMIFHLQHGVFAD